MCEQSPPGGSLAPIDHALDLRGKRCPYATMDAQRRLKAMAAGEVLEITSDYYPAKQTIPELARQLGYPCQVHDRDRPVFRVVIRKVR